ncbi:MAG: VanZ family protein [Prolixibacteraceae bacterium]|jgi:VanZ family protein|nr:VanZ family protein [Prolixibacteraceae bacterium]
MQKNIKYLYLIIWIALLIYALLTPPNALPKLKLFQHFDKVVHFGMFFTLVVILVPIYLSQQNYIRSYLFSFFTSVFTGILFEILQNNLTSGRTGSIDDAIADTAGAAIAVLFYHYFVRQKPLEKFVFRIQ